ncbi:MAG TPA: hypothetical protein VJS46_00500 [Rhizorhapis sp.]|nr:hypothetical protein [Rhizorhapis sp.]
MKRTLRNRNWSAFRLHGCFRSLKADFRMLPITKRFRRRRAASAKEYAALSGKVVEISIAVAQVKLAQVASHQIWSVFGRNNLYSHRTLL